MFFVIKFEGKFLLEELDTYNSSALVVSHKEALQNRNSKNQFHYYQIEYSKTRVISKFLITGFVVV